jgi:hypothetical protein
MIAVLGISPKEAFDLTYRRLYRMFLASQLNDWDQTTMLLSMVQNLTAVVCGVVGVYMRPMSAIDFHPYRLGGNPQPSISSSGGTKLRVDIDTFQTLKDVGSLILKGKRIR